MIRLRLLYLGMLLGAVGWMSVSSMTGPSPVLLGPAFILGGAVLIWFALPAARLGGTLAILAAQALAVPGVVALLARIQIIPGMAPLLAGIARLAGIDASAAGDRVTLGVAGQLAEFLPSPGRLLLFPIFLIAASSIALIVFVPVSRPGKFLLRLMLVLTGYTLLRALLLLAAQAELPEHGFATSRWIALLTLAPAFLLLPRTQEMAPAAKGSSLRLIAAFCAGLAWTVAIGWVDVGQPKAGRVLFDDSHGVWEPTDTPFDPQTYGQRFSYAYSSFLKLLSWHYDVKPHRDGPLSAAELAATDVLILKTPTEPFTTAEIGAIEQFVRSGGGLFLIGDHTNLFGMSTYLNAVASPFDVAFREDDTFDLDTEGLSSWTANRWLPHPIARVIKDFDFETSCTLSVPLTARAPIVGYGLGAEKADYSRPGFFGDLHLDPVDDFGFFVQLAVVDHGRGRVAALSDSTPLSNFSLFLPSRRELALSVVSFLNRRPTVWRYLPLLAFAVFAGAIGFLASFGRGSRTLLSSLSLLAGLGVGTLLVAQVGHLTLPEYKVPVQKVAFDRSISKLVLPSSLTLTHDQDGLALDTFFVSAQRMGYLPFVTDRVPATTSDADLLVLSHPLGNFTPQEAAALMRYVSGGGNLLVVDGFLSLGSATNQILQPFGLGVFPDVEHLSVSLAPKPGQSEGDRHIAAAPSPQSAEEAFSVSRPVLAVAGGTPLLTDKDGRVLLNQIRFGKGRVSVFVDSLSLSKAEMGARFPGEFTEPQREAHKLAYFVLKMAAGSQ